MYPEITIKISMTSEGAVVSKEPVPTEIHEEYAPPSPPPMEAMPSLEEVQVPDLPSLAEAEALAFDVGDAPGPPSLGELEATVTDEGELPAPPVLEELDALAIDLAEAPGPPSLEELEAAIAAEATAHEPPALAGLAGIPDKAAGATRAEPGYEPDRCRGLTKAGNPCKNRPVGGSIYCHVHQGG